MHSELDFKSQQVATGNFSSEAFRDVAWRVDAFKSFIDSHPEAIKFARSIELRAMESLSSPGVPADAFAIKNILTPEEKTRLLKHAQELIDFIEGSRGDRPSLRSLLQVPQITRNPRPGGPLLGGLVIALGLPLLLLGTPATAQTTDGFSTSQPQRSSTSSEPSFTDKQAISGAIGPVGETLRNMKSRQLEDVTHTKVGGRLSFVPNNRREWIENLLSLGIGTTLVFVTAFLFGVTPSMLLRNRSLGLSFIATADLIVFVALHWLDVKLRDASYKNIGYASRIVGASIPFVIPLYVLSLLTYTFGSPALTLMFTRCAYAGFALFFFAFLDNHRIVNAVVDNYGGVRMSVWKIFRTTLRWMSIHAQVQGLVGLFYLRGLLMDRGGLQDPQASRYNVFGKRLRALALPPDLTKASVERRQALKNAGPRIKAFLDKHFSADGHVADVDIAIVPIGSTLHGFAIDDSDVEYHLVVLGGIPPRIRFLSISEEVDEEMRQILEELGFVLDGRNFAMDNLYNFSGFVSGKSHDSAYYKKDILLGEWTHVIFYPVVYTSSEQKLEAVRKNVASFVYANETSDGTVWSDATEAHREISDITHYLVEAKAHCQSWLKALGVDPKSPEQLDQFLEQRNTSVELAPLDELVSMYNAALYHAKAVFFNPEDLSARPGAFNWWRWICWIGRGLSFRVYVSVRAGLTYLSTAHKTWIYKRNLRRKLALILKVPKGEISITSSAEHVAVWRDSPRGLIRVAHIEFKWEGKKLIVENHQCNVNDRGHVLALLLDYVRDLSRISNSASSAETVELAARTVASVLEQIEFSTYVRDQNGPMLTAAQRVTRWIFLDPRIKNPKKIKALAADGAFERTHIVVGPNVTLAKVTPSLPPRSVIITYAQLCEKNLVIFREDLERFQCSTLSILLDIYISKILKQHLDRKLLLLLEKLKTNVQGVLHLKPDTDYAAAETDYVDRQLEADDVSKLSQASKTISHVKAISVHINDLGVESFWGRQRRQLGKILAQA